MTKEDFDRRCGRSERAIYDTRVPTLRAGGARSAFTQVWSRRLRSKHNKHKSAQGNFRWLVMNLRQPKSARTARPPSGHDYQWVVLSRNYKLECVLTQGSGLYEVVAQKRKINTLKKRNTRHALRDKKNETEKKTRPSIWRSDTKTETQKWRNKEKRDIMRSLNIKITLNSVTSDWGHPSRAKGFKLRPLPVTYSNVIWSSPSHKFCAFFLNHITNS